ncbi:hypothetical protein QBC44DRAFT_397239 [Cladorrhinum sp. PSN332]|nr:hypothetical protein QBC44DRAFT_397239 [Cladorrhinum sp. PSN332]
MSTSGDPSLLPHDDAGPDVVAVAWALWTFAAAFLSVRIYCKHVSGRGLWWDDRFLLAAQFMHLISCALISSMVENHHYGKHPWDRPATSTPETILTMTRTTVTVTAAAWSKTSFAITLLRIAKGWVKWLVWFIIITMNVALGLNAMISWVACQPIQKSWDPTLPGTCIPSAITALGYLSGSYSAACDFTLALLPWAVIWNLHMRTKEKLGVCLAMSMGIAAGVMAAVKTAHLKNLTTGDSFDAAKLSVFDNAEISVTVIATSIPALRTLFNDIRSATKGATKKYFEPTPRYGNRSVVITVKGADSGSGEERSDHDNKSDRGILVSDRDQKIYRVDEVEIVSIYGGKKSAGDEDEYEIGGLGNK